MPEDDLVAFFRSLTPAKRREYDALAERDRRHGEDVEADRSESDKQRAKRRSTENLS